jgi:CDP-paratose 2-epimerase
VLVTGSCGFVGSTLVRRWVEQGTHKLIGIDNFARAGSEQNRAALRTLGVSFRHADLRLPSDVDALPPADVVVDAAANPSVLAGIDARSSSRQLVEHNLVGTINMLEYCRVYRATFVMLSTSRVYGLSALATLPVRIANDAFVPDETAPFPAGLTSEGVSETFSTMPPVSLYGATKVASEQLALEYGSVFGFQVWVNRCGVLAGAGQFGRPDQGIFSYWVNSWLRKRPLRYIGFGGLGHQVRDCLHPDDIVPLIDRQIRAAGRVDAPRVVNVSGGIESARSLAQLSAWCRGRLGDHAVDSVAERRPFDVPWLVLDSALARRTWNWAPSRTTESICEEILSHAQAHPDWLEITGHA